MPMVHQCTRPGCRTLTMGERCLEHEQHADVPADVRKLFPRVATATGVHRSRGVERFSLCNNEGKEREAGGLSMPKSQRNVSLRMIRIRSPARNAKS